LGGVVSTLLVVPMGIGGEGQYGAWLYIAIVVAVVTWIVDRLLRIPFKRWLPAGAFALIPILSSAVGIAAGWLAANYSMGGPTKPRPRVSKGPAT
jgi:hypothetical protein